MDDSSDGSHLYLATSIKAGARVLVPSLLMKVDANNPVRDILHAIVEKKKTEVPGLEDLVSRGRCRVELFKRPGAAVQYL